jgi:DNA polymerase-3 subunit gamma/tau
MGYQVLARKYRPQRFADVAGQDHVTRTLMNALARTASRTATSSQGIAALAKPPLRALWRMALNCRTEVGTPAGPRRNHAASATPASRFARATRWT